VRRQSLVRKLVLLVAVAVSSGMAVSALLAMGQEVERYADTRRELMRAPLMAVTIRLQMANPSPVGD
jgi:hypothetical protein